jgi:hypothetical protein
LKQEPRQVAGFFVSPHLSLHSTVRIGMNQGV